VRLLLDTNALIWTLAAPQRLSAQAAEEIGSGSNEIFVSPVSAMEIGLKRSKGRLSLRGDLAQVMGERGFQPLPLTLDHALAIESLPALHGDPFDRMLVAQAHVEELILVTSNRLLQRYPIATMPT